jgi:hypothetical protein
MMLFFARSPARALCRNGHIDALSNINTKLRPAVLRHLPKVTIAIDIGTVHRRYLAFVVVGRGRAFHWKMVDDTAVGGHFTAQVVKEEVLGVIAELAAQKVTVVSVVADNAANMQAIANDNAISRDAAIEANAEDPLRAVVQDVIPMMTRCACHVVQLAVQDLLPLWEAAFNIAKNVCTTNNIKVTETKRASSPLGRARHTSILQIESVLETRSRMLFIKPYLMIAYFSPTLDRSTSTAEVVAPIVKNMLVLLDAEIVLERQRWTILVLDVVEGPVTREAYVEHLLPLKKVCPKMHGIIINALGATPSEAAVERLFSRLTTR